MWGGELREDNQNPGVHESGWMYIPEINIFTQATRRPAQQRLIEGKGRERKRERESLMMRKLGLKMKEF
jgi:hypothetical protein